MKFSIKAVIVISSVSGYVLMLYSIYLGTKKDVDGVRRLGVFG